MPRKYTPQQAINSFWNSVAITADDEQCWLWTAGYNSNGYGQKCWNGKRSEKAHRVSWMITHGVIPDGLEVLHTCDNPKCVNPKHLFLGTQLENIADMKAKGRAVKRPDLTPEIRKEIHQLYNIDKVHQRTLAKKYHVSQRTICLIVNNKVHKQ